MDNIHQLINGRSETAGPTQSWFAFCTRDHQQPDCTLEQLDTRGLRTTILETFPEEINLYRILILHPAAVVSSYEKL